MAVAAAIVDLDARPELTSAALAALVAAGPGSHHLITGFAHRMGLPPVADDFRNCLGVILACRSTRLLGVLALCGYSRQQATLWGPTMPSGATHDAAELLVAEAKRALRAAGFESARALVDTRNRVLRAFLLARGFTPWKDDQLFEAALVPAAPDPCVRPVAPADRIEVTTILTEAFPDGDHCRPGLSAREREGCRHYLVEADGRIAGAAVVQHSGRRAWLKMIAVRRELRVKRLGSRLLKGVMGVEAALGMTAIALEVLADNPRAITLYEHAGFARRWTATVMTAPV
jgi:ribosomal protein S18 acetylase RimI-like enzyme